MEQRKLYGLNPQTGQLIVTQASPTMEHFTTRSASDGKLLLATGQTVEAYAIANPGPPTSAPTPTTAPTTAPSPAKCTLRLRSNRVKIHHPSRAEASGPSLVRANLKAGAARTFQLRIHARPPARA